MFGHQGSLLIDILRGLPHACLSIDSHEISRKTQDNLQLAFEIARRKFRDRAAKHETVKLIALFRFQTGTATFALSLVWNHGGTQFQIALSSARIFHYVNADLARHLSR